MLGYLLCCQRIWPSLLVLLCVNLHTSFADQSTEPEFAEQVPNITVAVGREAVLSCVVEHLGNYRVAWIKVDTQTIYTMHTHVIQHNSRIGATHNGHRIWKLHIRNVQEEDRGFYMCQINTSPMKHQVGYINIVSSPDIIYEQSSSDVVINEGGNVALICRAIGYPAPKITWRREDGRSIVVRTENREKLRVLTIDGDSLNFTKVTRKHMGAYLCIASNGVPPSVSKRIFLQVNIKPKVKVSTQVLGAPIGADVTMECLIEASPKPVNFWTRENGDYLASGPKFVVTENIDSYEMKFILKIRNIEEKDFGTYNCTAKNLLGESEGSIQLIEMAVPTMKSRTEMWQTKESSMQITGRTEEPSSLNKTFASQKALDSFKHSYVNEFEKYPDKNIEPPKGGAVIQSKPSKVMKTEEKGGSHRTDTSSNGGRRKLDDTSIVLPLLLLVWLLSSCACLLKSTPFTNISNNKMVFV